MDNKTLDVVQAKKYTNKNGEEKTQWLKIGKCFTKMDLVSGNLQLCHNLHENLDFSSS